MCLIIKTEVVAGTRIFTAVKCAIRLAKATGCMVEFDFNGKTVYIPSHLDYNDVNEIVAKYEGGYYDY